MTSDRDPSPPQTPPATPASTRAEAPLRQADLFVAVSAAAAPVAAIAAGRLLPAQTVVAWTVAALVIESLRLSAIVAVTRGRRQEPIFVLASWGSALLWLALAALLVLPPVSGPALILLLPLALAGLAGFGLSVSPAAGLGSALILTLGTAGLLRLLSTSAAGPQAATLLPQPAILAYGGALMLLLLRQAVNRRAEQAERVRLQEELARLMQEAASDPLTGLMNRRSWMDLAIRELDRYRRHGRPVAFVLIDLDHFKRINDRFGHATGDRVLRLFARAVESALRSNDRLARIGGEEFALMLPECDRQGAMILTERLRQLIESLSFTGPNQELVRFTASMGVVCLEVRAGGPVETMVSIDRILDQADKALYAAKNAGRNRVLFAPADG